MHSYLKGHPALIDAVKRLEQLNPDQFELFFQRKTSTRIDSKDQQVDSLSRSEDVGLAVRLIKDRRMGFSFTTSLERDSIYKAMETALEIASFMPEDEHLSLPSFSSFVYPDVDNHDAAGLKIPLAQKIETAKRLEALTRSVDKRINAIRSASIGETVSEIHLVDSHGEHIQHQSTLYSASVTCKAEEDGDSQVGRDFGFSNYLDNLDIASVAKTAGLRATELLKSGQAPTMRVPAVLRNNVVADLISFLAESFSAESIDKGRSILAGRQGNRIFSENVTLIDDGLLAGGIATSPFDGEGIPSTQTTLVDGGFFSNVLYDTYYAKKFEKEPTGSAARGIKAPPSISPSNLYMKKGRKSLSQLLEGVPRGIIITELMGLHTANPVTGDFSLGASGILVEHGEMVRPVRGFAVAGNVLDLFQKMTDIGNDFRFFGNIGAPSVRVAELSIGGK